MNGANNCSCADLVVTASRRSCVEGVYLIDLGGREGDRSWNPVTF